MNLYEQKQEVLEKLKNLRSRLECLELWQEIKTEEKVLQMIQGRIEDESRIKANQEYLQSIASMKEAGFEVRVGDFAFDLDNEQYNFIVMLKSYPDIKHLIEGKQSILVYWEWDNNGISYEKEENCILGKGETEHEAWQDAINNWASQLEKSKS